MENEEIFKKLEEQDKKITDIYISTEKTRKYFLWTMIITIAVIVLPLIVMAFLAPWFIQIMTSAYNIQ
ncbi:MAG: hypothetical protein NTZ97_01325 [Candidatus Moranbacteria bacterium]|nr:hypothetical protein [Candidatus Moranbacteria bacterium]